MKVDGLHNADGSVADQDVESPEVVQSGSGVVDSRLFLRDVAVDDVEFSGMESARLQQLFWYLFSAKDGDDSCGATVKKGACDCQPDAGGRARDDDYFVCKGYLHG
jgi:hypothetical protein